MFKQYHVANPLKSFSPKIYLSEEKVNKLTAHIACCERIANCYAQGSHERESLESLIGHAKAILEWAKEQIKNAEKLERDTMYAFMEDLAKEV